MLLADALRDISRQGFRHFEVVVVDDGDDPALTRSVIDSVSDLVGRARLVDCTGAEHGRSKAANAGLESARGEYIVLHDDDDSWDESFLASTVGFLDAHPNSVAVGAHTEVVIHRTDPETGDQVQETRLLNPTMTTITISDMLRANRITTNSLLYRSRLHQELGYFDETLPVLEDWEFYLRVISRYAIDLLPLPALARWHHRPEADGPDSNSVFALDADHRDLESRVRDDQFRKNLSPSSWANAMHLASEMRRLDSRLDQIQSAMDELQRRLTGFDDAVRYAGGDIRANLDGIRDLLVARTSVSGLFRRLGAFLTGRR